MSRKIAFDVGGIVLKPDLMLSYRFTWCKGSEPYPLANVCSTMGRYFLIQPVATSYVILHTGTRQLASFLTSGRAK